VERNKNIRALVAKKNDVRAKKQDKRQKTKENRDKNIRAFVAKKNGLEN